MTLTADQVATFGREGYLVVEGLFSDADLQPVIDELTAEVDRRARDLVAAGGLSRPYDELPFESRLTAITAEADAVYTSIVSGQLAGPAIFGLIAHPDLLDLAESLVGPEVIASSAYRLRPKVPGYPHGVVPWHQDSGYFEPWCDRSLIVTVWIPLVDATVERGCLEVLPRAHAGEIVRHVRGQHYLEIPPEDMPPGEPVAVPVPKGGALLLTNRTPHRSTENISDVVRWSMDLRYQSADLPTNYVLPDDSRFRAPFDGEPVACYPPEADFLVRSRRRADAVVREWRHFADLRAHHAPGTLTRRWS